MDWYKMGQRIRELRESKGMTQEALAEKFHCVREQVKHWENGTRKLKADTIVELANFFGVTTDYILCASESKSPADTDVTLLIDRFGFSPKAARVLTMLSIPQNGEWTQRQFEALNKLLELTEFEGALQGLAECRCFAQSNTPFEAAINSGSFPDSLQSFVANKDNYIRSDRAQYRSAAIFNVVDWMRKIAEKFVEESERTASKEALQSGKKE